MTIPFDSPLLNYGDDVLLIYLDGCNIIVVDIIISSSIVINIITIILFLIIKVYNLLSLRWNIVELW